MKKNIYLILKYINSENILKYMLAPSYTTEMKKKHSILNYIDYENFQKHCIALQVVICNPPMTAITRLNFINLYMLICFILAKYAYMHTWVLGRGVMRTHLSNHTVNKNE